MKILILVLLFSIQMLCNESKKESINNMNKEYSKIFVFSSFGFYEIIALGIGFNITETWGISIKGNLFLLRSSFLYNGSPGIGIKIHKRLFYGSGTYFIDTINLEGSFGTNRPDMGYTKSKEIQLNFASEKTYCKDLNFYYSFGVGYTYENRNGEMISPIIKIGGIYNF